MAIYRTRKYKGGCGVENNFFVRMNELTIKSDECTKNYFTASFLWSLKNSATTAIDDVENYLAVFDVIDVQKMKCSRYFAISAPSRRKQNGDCGKTCLDFAAVSKDAPYFQNFFHTLFENMSDGELYYGSKEEMDSRINRFPQHCFTYECLNTILTMFYDFYSFETMMVNACVCNRFLLNVYIQFQRDYVVFILHV